MSQSSTLPPAVQAEEHWHQDDIDIATEAEYRREQDRRFAADPSPEDIAFWFAETRDDDGQEPNDAHYDAWYAESLAQDRIDRGCLL